MSFNIGLSGLNASAKNLDVIGHNIANVNTVGMKAQRAEFAELYASSLGSAGGMGLGMGTSIATVSQEFTQGNLSDTGNELDLAINGAGFFTLEASNGERIYTRAGNFKLDEAGEIVANNGAKLIDPTTGKAYAWPNGGVSPGKETTGVTMELNLDTRAPIADIDSVTSQAKPPLTTYGTTLQVFDTQGDAISMDFYFKKTEANVWAVYAKYPEDSASPGPAAGTAGTGAPNDANSGTKGVVNDAWGQTSPELVYWDPNPAGPAYKPAVTGPAGGAASPDLTPIAFIRFDESGKVNAVRPFDPADVSADFSAPDLLQYDDATGLWAPAAGWSSATAWPEETAISGTSDWYTLPITLNTIKNTNGTTDTLGFGNNPEGISVDFSKITQNAQEFSVSALEQDGNPPGFLTKISVEDDGTISAKYTNGQTESMGQIKLANFRNVSGLEPSSGGYWVESKDSGGPVFGVPGSGSFGQLRGGSLEESNVDLTAELVNMMTAQRNYQANSQTIKTQDQIMNTVINLK